MNNETKTILVIGGSGSLGTALISKLLVRFPLADIHCIDTKLFPVKSTRLIFHKIDIRSKEISTIIQKINCQIVFHLVGIISNPHLTHYDIYNIEINGLQKVLKACYANHVEHFIFISSGSVYGFKPDLPRYIPEYQPLETDNPIRYAQNKALAEDLITRFCKTNPLKTTIFRPCSILGKNSKNIVLKWFDRKVIIGLKDTFTPFSFVWEEDLVECLIEAMENQILGTFNVAAHGWVSLEEIASLQSKKYITIKKNRLSRWIGFLNRLTLIEYKKEYLDFIRYRPVLNRKKLTTHFKYHFKKTSLEAFKDYLKFRSA